MLIRIHSKFCHQPECGCHFGLQMLGVRSSPLVIFPTQPQPFPFVTGLIVYVTQLIFFSIIVVILELKSR